MVSISISRKLPDITTIILSGSVAFVKDDIANRTLRADVNGFSQSIFRSPCVASFMLRISCCISCRRQMLSGSSARVKNRGRDVHRKNNRRR